MKNFILSIFAILFLGTGVYGQVTESDFDYHGLKHNELLEELLLSFDSKTTKENVYNQCLDYLKSNKEYSNTAFMKFQNYSSPYLMLKELKGKLSNNLYSKVEGDLKALENMKDYTHVSDYVHNAIKNSTVLQKNERSHYLSFLSVLKHSSYFWDVNGKNGVKFLKTGVSKKSRINWWKVAGCDAVGAIGGALVSGGTATLVGAGVASACSIINQY